MPGGEGGGGVKFLISCSPGPFKITFHSSMWFIRLAFVCFRYLITPTRVLCPFLPLPTCVMRHNTYKNISIPAAYRVIGMKGDIPYSSPYA